MYIPQVDLRCQHKTYSSSPKTTKNTNCPATMFLILKRFMNERKSRWDKKWDQKHNTIQQNIWTPKLLVTINLICRKSCNLFWNSALKHNTSSVLPFTDQETHTLKRAISFMWTWGMNIIIDWTQLSSWGGEMWRMTPLKSYNSSTKVVTLLHLHSRLLNTTCRKRKAITTLMLLRIDPFAQTFSSATGQSFSKIVKSVFKMCNVNVVKLFMSQ